MIKTEFKTRVYNDLESARKKRSKSIKERSKSNKKDASTIRSNASSKVLRYVRSSKARRL
jgi:hypothetical protein